MQRWMRMKPEYLKLLKVGRKSTTIRRGDKTDKLQIGQSLTIRDRQGGVVRCRIRNLQTTTARFLTADDARRDGFKSRPELIDVLHKLNRGLKWDELLTVITLEVT